MHHWSYFRRCMMDKGILERRRLLQLFLLGSLAVPAIDPNRLRCRFRPPHSGHRSSAAGNSDKNGNHGGPGGFGSRKGRTKRTSSCAPPVAQGESSPHIHWDRRHPIFRGA